MFFGTLIVVVENTFCDFVATEIRVDEKQHSVGWVRVPSKVHAELLEVIRGVAGFAKEPHSALREKQKFVEQGEYFRRWLMNAEDDCFALKTSEEISYCYYG